jgi:hypothetical protein
LVTGPAAAALARHSNSSHSKPSSLRQQQQQQQQHQELMQPLGEGQTAAAREAAEDLEGLLSPSRTLTAPPPDASGAAGGSFGVVPRKARSAPHRKAEAEQQPGLPAHPGVAPAPGVQQHPAGQPQQQAPVPAPASDDDEEEEEEEARLLVAIGKLEVMRAECLPLIRGMLEERQEPDCVAKTGGWCSLHAWRTLAAGAALLHERLVPAAAGRATGQHCAQPLMGKLQTGLARLPACPVLFLQASQRTSWCCAWTPSRAAGSCAASCTASGQTWCLKASTGALHMLLCLA